VKINLMIRPLSFLPIKYYSLLPKLSQAVVIKYNSNFLLIFMQDSGISFYPQRFLTGIVSAWLSSVAAMQFLVIFVR